MIDDKKKDVSPLHLVEPGKAEEPKQEHEVIGVPFIKDKFVTLFDNNEDPAVMFFTVPIKALATDAGRDSLAMLLGKIELFKGEAHKVFKGIRADMAAKGPKLIMPGGGPLPPMGRA